MIFARQRKKATAEAIEDILKRGEFPSAQQVLQEVADRYRGKVWGKPLTTVRAAVAGMPVGGESGDDIEKTYSELTEDTRIAYESMVDVANMALAEHRILDTRSARLRQRLSAVSARISAAVARLSTGAAYMLSGEFSSTDNVDLGVSSAEVDLEQAAAVLPRAREATSPVDCSQAALEAQVVPDGAQVRSDILNAFDDTYNTIWQASLGGAQYSAVIRLTKDSQPQAFNAVQIEPLTRILVQVEWSNDGGNNFYAVGSGKISSATTWTLPERQSLTHMRITVSGKEVGIRNIRPLVVAHERVGQLYTQVMEVADYDGVQADLHSARILMDADLPKGTSIEAYAQVGQDDTWVRLTSLPTAVGESADVAADLDEALAEPDTGTPPLYRFPSINFRTIVGTEKLYKGVGQMRVDYFNYDWAIEDDPGHIPSQKDWPGTEFSTRYLTPLASMAMSSGGNFNPLSSTSPALSVTQSPLAECMGSSFTGSSPTTALSTDDMRRWLTIAVLDGEGTQMLTPCGNYRFTSYLYSPSDILLRDMPAFIYNPASFGGSGSPVVAPFSIYLNDQCLLYSIKSYAIMNSSNIGEFSAAYQIRRGWNKLEILVYYPGSSVSGIDQDGTASGAVGLYVQPNLFAFDPLLYRVQATQGPQKKVTEFALRSVISPGDSECWAMAGEESLAGGARVLLNYDPSGELTPAGFDGRTAGHRPEMRLELRRHTSATSTPRGTVRLRFDLSRDSSTAATPKLFGYTLLMD